MTWIGLAFQLRTPVGLKATMRIIRRDARVQPADFVYYDPYKRERIEAEQVTSAQAAASSAGLVTEVTDEGPEEQGGGRNTTSPMQGVVTENATSRTVRDAVNYEEEDDPDDPFGSAPLGSHRPPTSPGNEPESRATVRPAAKNPQPNVPPASSAGASKSVPRESATVQVTPPTKAAIEKSKPTAPVSSGDKDDTPASTGDKTTVSKPTASRPGPRTRPVSTTVRSRADKQTVSKTGPSSNGEDN